jgi:uncharacterized protein (TIGR02231 family)
MKKIALIMLIAVLGWVIPGYASQFLSSNITEVTLFSDQALVERTCKTNVQPGTNDLLVELTAVAVEKNSVSARIIGTGEILSVQIKDIFLTEAPQQQIQALEEKLRALQKSLTTLNDKEKVLLKQGRFLDTLMDISNTQAPKDFQFRFPEVENLKETVSYLGSAWETINSEKQKIDQDKTDVTRNIERLKKELAAVRGAEQKQKQAVEVRYDAKQAETIQMQIQYIVHRAAWNPVYKASVPLDLSGLELTLFSNILQKTGEDWKNVNLIISNVTPLKGVRLPKLSSWTLDLPRPRPAAKRTLMFEKKQSTLADSAQIAALGASQTEAEAGYAMAEQKELPISFEYRIPNPVNIPSRDTDSLLPVLTKRLKGDFFYYAIPKKSGLTYLVAESKADRELLSGRLNVYFNGRFLGETVLAEKNPGEPFYLNLGADRAVTVKRQKIRDQKKETFFGAVDRKTVHREFEYKLTLENLKDSPVMLKIEDSVPVSATDKIEVKDIRLSPEPSLKDYQEKAGVMLWEMKLAAGEKKEIQIGFTVTYPADTPPFGLMD